MKRVSLFVPEELLQALQTLKQRDGIPAAESIRRATAAYLAENGVMKTSKKSTAKR